MLELKGLSKHFGGVKAVDGLDLNVKSGEIFGLIGPNGSGKSTTINLICGLMDVTAGNIAIDGRDISGAAPHEVVDAGIGRTFQNIRLFHGLTVWQNLWVAQKESQNGNESRFFRRWLSGRGNARENIKKEPPQSKKDTQKKDNLAKSIGSNFSKSF